MRGFTFRHFGLLLLAGALLVSLGINGWFHLEREALTDRNVSLKVQADQLRDERHILLLERERLSGHIVALDLEKDRLASDKANLIAERERLTQDNAALVQFNRYLNHENADLHTAILRARSLADFSNDTDADVLGRLMFGGISPPR